MSHPINIRFTFNNNLVTKQSLKAFTAGEKNMIIPFPFLMKDHHLMDIPLLFHQSLIDV